MAMFRRTKSPRNVEFRTTDKHEDSRQHRELSDKKRDSHTEHRRHKSDELNSILESLETPTFLSQSEEVVDYQLSDPGPLFFPPQLPPRNRGGSGSSSNRSQDFARPTWRRVRSSGTCTMSGKQVHHQLLRGGHQPPEYNAPVDTLRNLHRSHNSSSSTNSHSQHNGSVMVGGKPSSRDMRNKEMHDKIVAQKEQRKSRSMEDLLDTNDYSTPFDVLPSDKSRSPEGTSNLVPPSNPNASRSDTNLHKLNQAPLKPARSQRHAPNFAPPPPPDDSSLPTNSSPRIRRMDDYEEPWNSARSYLPKVPGRRADNSPRLRAHTLHQDIASTDPDLLSTLPPRSTLGRNRSDTDHTQPQMPSSPNLDIGLRQRTTSGQSDDYCIPPDAILHELNNGVVIGGVVGRGGDTNHAYVNQPPMPPHNTTDTTRQKHGYPPLLPSDHYITDVQNLPPPAHPINTSLPLEDQPWYHGRISRDQAEDILFNQPDFSFLLRKSESSRMDYSLSIRDRTSPAAQGFIHLKITQEKAGYVLGQFSAPFHSVPLCIAFYTQRELTIKHINHRRLGFPVGRIKNMHL